MSLLVRGIDRRRIDAGQHPNPAGRLMVRIIQRSAATVARPMAVRPTIDSPPFPREMLIPIVISRIEERRHRVVSAGRFP